MIDSPISVRGGIGSIQSVVVDSNGVPKYDIILNDVGRPRLWFSKRIQRQILSGRTTVSIRGNCGGRGLAGIRKGNSTAPGELRKSNDEEKQKAWPPLGNQVPGPEKIPRGPTRGKKSYTDQRGEKVFPSADPDSRVSTWGTRVMDLRSVRAWGNQGKHVQNDVVFFELRRGGSSS